MNAVHRIEVRPKDGMPDVRGSGVQKRAAAEHGLAKPTSVRSAQVYLLEGAIDAASLQRVATELLADPVTQQVTVGAAATNGFVVEVLPLPGVTDTAAESVELAIEQLTGAKVRVLTGDRWDLQGVDRAQADAIGQRLLANPVVQAVHAAPWMPTHFPEAKTRTAEVRHVPLCNLDDAALERLSREAHLFLSLDEMRAVQAEYRSKGREPREIELETIADLERALRSQDAEEPCALHGAGPCGGFTLAACARGCGCRPLA